MSSVSTQYATAEVGCMPSATDPHRSQLISPFNHRRIEFAAAFAFSQTSAKSLWIGCDDSDGDGSWTDRLEKLLHDTTFELLAQLKKENCTFRVSNFAFAILNTYFGGIFWQTLWIPSMSRSWNSTLKMRHLDTVWTCKSISTTYSTLNRVLLRYLLKIQTYLFWNAPPCNLGFLYCCSQLKHHMSKLKLSTYYCLFTFFITVNILLFFFYYYCLFTFLKYNLVLERTWPPWWSLQSSTTIRLELPASAASTKKEMPGKSKSSF